jgi:hydrogenase nickel incorporation protein HypA/HybF
MHEIYLVRNIFKTLEDAFPGKVQNVRKVSLRVGILSNVQPILMQNAFAAVLQDDPVYKMASLDIEVLPIVIYCDTCDKSTSVNDYKFYCSCGIPCSNVIQGKELMISAVEFCQ